MGTSEFASLFESELRPDVPRGDAWQAWRVRPLTPDAFDTLGGGLAGSTRLQLGYLACFGLLAPTTHNTVPQRFELREDSSEIRVWLDRRRVLPESDPTGRQASISIGCVVANMELAASAVGLDAELEVVHGAEPRVGPVTDGDEDPLTRVATLRFVRAASGRSPIDWCDLMRKRKMVRAKYDESLSLPKGVSEQLQAEVEADERLRLHLLTDAPTLLFLGKFQELADSTVVNRTGFARELGDWLLENDDPSFVGMRGREFGLSDEASKRFHLGLRGELQLLPDETVGFAKAGNIGMRSASAVGVITVAADDLEQRLLAGRAFQRTALLALHHGFVVAMHAGITEVDAPNMALRGRLRTRRRPTVVFRFGRPRDPRDGDRPHASRPRLDSVLLPERD